MQYHTSYYMNRQEGTHGIHIWADLKYRIYHTCHIHYYAKTLLSATTKYYCNFYGILPTKFN